MKAWMAVEGTKDALEGMTRPSLCLLLRGHVVMSSFKEVRVGRLRARKVPNFSS